MRVIASVVLTVTILVPAATEQTLPRIEQLDPSDAIFAQHRESAEWARASSGRGHSPPPLIISTYRRKPDETLMYIANQLSLPVHTLLTLNRIADDRNPPSEVLVPNLPGVFVPRDPVTPFELVLWRSRNRSNAQSVTLPSGKLDFYFNDELTEIEQAFRESGGFASPLEAAVISSPYGPRRHPIRGTSMFHHGVDLAAAYGAPVRAIAHGRVSEIGRDQRLGLWVEVEHADGLVTRYAHLRVVTVELKQDIRSGMIIGEVGSTGYSTGPHLHIELRWRGRSVDPASYFTFGTDGW